MGILGIIGAMDIEVQLIKDKMSNLEEVNYKAFKFYKGKYNGIDVIITTCGVGKVNAASCTQILIDRFNITHIINTGIAGSLNKDVKACDIVISDDVTYHDVRIEQMKNLFPFRENFKADGVLIDMAVKACQNTPLGKCNYHVGRIVTGEGFISSNELKKIIAEKYDSHCVDMESGAIGHVAYLNSIPFVIIRSISDNADNDASITYDEFEEIASNNSANIVLGMVSSIGVGANG